MANVWYVDSVKYTAVTQWAAGATVTAGAIRRQLAAPAIGNERCFVVTTGGVTGGSEPSWNLGVAATTNDNGVIWTECTGSSTYGWSAAGARYANILTPGLWTAAGDEVWMGSTHAESYTTPPTIALPQFSTSPVATIGASNSAAPPTALSTSPTLTFTGTGTLVFGGNFIVYNNYTYGMNFIAASGTSAGSFQFSGLGNGTMVWEACNFSLSNTSASSEIILANPYGPLQLQFYNCTFWFGSTSQNINVQSSSPTQVLFSGGGMATTGTVAVPTTLFVLNGSSSGGVIVVRDMDLSAVTGTLVSYNGNNAGSITFENCKLGAGVTPMSGTIDNGGFFIKLHNCDSGSTNYRYHYRNATATVTSDTTHVRTGGASDGTTALAWQVATTSKASYYVPFVTEEIAQWSSLTSGTHTATICLASNSTLTNGQVWAELEFPGTSGFPLGVATSSRAVFTATAATLTTDSSTWGGSPTNIYKIAISFNPLNAGPLKMRVYVGAASTTVWIDPLITVV